MTLTLDQWIFGNGHGLKSPYFDDIYLWLVDTKPAERSGSNGRRYTWIGGIGAQLRSFEWRVPKPGTRRILAGREFVVFNATRRGLRVDVSWALVGLPRSLDEANAAIRELSALLHQPYRT